MIHSSESAVAWLVLSPLAVITNIIAIVVVSHYKAQFHGTDVVFISLFVSMLAQCVFSLPIAAVIDLKNDGWTSDLCSFYVWLFVCVRISDLLTTVIMNMYWMCILRLTSGKDVYRSIFVVKVLICVTWFTGLVTGLVPVTGFSLYTYFQDSSNEGKSNSLAEKGECFFLPRNLGSSFALFFIVATLASVFLSLVSSSDSLLLFRYMRQTALCKYKAGRFYLPPSSTLVQSGANAGFLNYDGVNGTIKTNRADRHQEEHFVGQQLTKDSRKSNNNKRAESDYSTRGTIAGRLQNGLDTNRTQAASFHHLDGTDIPFVNDVTLQQGIKGKRRSKLDVGKPGVSSLDVKTVVHPGSSLTRSSPYTVHAKYNDLNLSFDLCRLVLCYTLATAFITFLPFVAFQFAQLTNAVDRSVAETSVLWLTLTQALFVPHLLWMFSRRYRHALVYTWSVNVCRDDSLREEDPSACTLQSYTRHVRRPDGATIRMTARNNQEPITLAIYDNIKISDNQQSEDLTAYVESADGDNNLDSSTELHGSASRDWHYLGSSTELNGRRGAVEVITTDLDDGMTVITNLASHQVTYIYETPSASNPTEQDTGCQPDNLWHVVNNEIPTSPDNSSLATTSPGKASLATSPSRSSVGTPLHSFEIQRSGSARLVWKEQMRKKHLPAIFTNEAFVMEESVHRERLETLPDIAMVNTHHFWRGLGDNANELKDDIHSKIIWNNLHDVDEREDEGTKQQTRDDKSYLHTTRNNNYDFARESVPRPRHHLESDSDTDTDSCQYEDKDIERILDRQHSLDDRVRSWNDGTVPEDNVEKQVSIGGQSLHDFKKQFDGRVQALTENNETNEDNQITMPSSNYSHSPLVSTNSTTVDSDCTAMIADRPPLDQYETANNSMITSQRGNNYAAQSLHPQLTSHQHIPMRQDPEGSNRNTWKDNSNRTMTKDDEILSQESDDSGEQMITRVRDGIRPPITAVVLDVLETNSTGSGNCFTDEPLHQYNQPLEPYYDDNQPLDSYSHGLQLDLDKSYIVNGLEFGQNQSNHKKEKLLDSENDFNHYNINRYLDSVQDCALDECELDAFEIKRDSKHNSLLFNSDPELFDGWQSRVMPLDIVATDSDNPRPLSFDFEAERELEETNVKQRNPEPTFYGSESLCFESIKEEPEELDDFMNYSNQVTDMTLPENQSEKQNMKILTNISNTINESVPKIPANLSHKNSDTDNFVPPLSIRISADGSESGQLADESELGHAADESESGHIAHGSGSGQSMDGSESGQSYSPLESVIIPLGQRSSMGSAVNDILTAPCGPITNVHTYTKTVSSDFHGKEDFGRDGFCFGFDSSAVKTSLNPENIAASIHNNPSIHYQQMTMSTNIADDTNGSVKNYVHPVYF